VVSISLAGLIEHVTMMFDYTTAAEINY